MKARQSLSRWCGIASLCLGTVHAADHPATLDWAGRVTLAMPLPGVVDRVAVQAGQRVKQGDLLARLDPTPFQTAVAEAKADMDRMALEQADARRELDRAKELYARTVSSTTELDAAQLRHDRATASLASAQARLERARHQLAQSELRAPFDALILARFAEPGLVAAPLCQPNPLFNVARAQELLAVTHLPAAQALGHPPGSQAQVVVGARTMGGVVHGLAPEGGDKYRLEIAFPRADDLAPGQAASVRLP